jgi:integrase
MVLTPTRTNTTEITIYLAALRQLYSFAVKNKLYRFPHPFQYFLSLEQNDEERPPPMPFCSGVQEPPNERSRLTQAYFVLKDKTWVPEIIDDSTLPSRVLAAGATANWRLRERIVTRLLFETGARISEVCGLTLGDWNSLGLRHSASAFSKGSHLRRVKYLHFSESTAKLLRRYFDHDRRQFDEHGWGLTDYLRNTDSGHQHLAPLFLTKQKTTLTPSTFRDVYWRPACKAGGLRVNIHQARHWYVTSAIREIHGTYPAGAERDARINELVVYMAWRNGQVTLASYNHYFDKINFAAIQDGLHRKLDRTLKKRISGLSQDKATPRPPVVSPVPDVALSADPDWEFLRKLAGP